MAVAAVHPEQQAFLDAGNTTTDKIGRHGYHRFYPWFLAALRDRPARILEIGIDRLGSIQFWRRYFRGEFELHGIDRDEKQFDDPNVHLHRIDQSDEVALTRFTSDFGEFFDLIVDDGSHVPAHQLLTLATLWRALKPGGIYIIEDVETSYWGRAEIYGYQFDARDRRENAIQQLKAAVDAVNSEFLSPGEKRTLTAHRLGHVLLDIEMVTFGHNCVILVKKDAASFGEYYARPYRYAGLVMMRSRRVRLARALKRLGVRGMIATAIRRVLRRS